MYGDYDDEYWTGRESLDYNDPEFEDDYDDDYEDDDDFEDYDDYGYIPGMEGDY